MPFTFTTKVKNSLVRSFLPEKCCLQAELAAFLSAKGNIEISSGRLALTIVTENPALARRIFLLFKKVFYLKAEIFSRKKTRLKKNNTYLAQVRGEENVRHILKSLGKTGKDGRWGTGINRTLLKKTCCKKAFLRGAFLASGYVSGPASSYHLEMVMPYEGHARVLLSFLESFDLQGKINYRKKAYVVYLKGSDAISGFLQVIGAHQALLSFENTRVIKNVRNQVNRLVNFETANLTRTVEAALKQVEDIRLILKVAGWDALPKNLQPLARLRLSHPEVTLQELGSMLTPPLSKSGVNHRLRKIKRLAEKMTTRTDMREHLNAHF